MAYYYNLIQITAPIENDQFGVTHKDIATCRNKPRFGGVFLYAGMSVFGRSETVARKLTEGLLHTA